MATILTIFSIFAVSALVGLINKALPFRICPVCVGVSGTWLLLTALSVNGYLDRETFLPMILLLMGGSVVGIAYQGEKSSPWAVAHPLVWKITIVIVGMPLASWAAIEARIEVLIAEIILLSIVGYFYFVRPAG